MEIRSIKTPIDVPRAAAIGQLAHAIHTGCDCAIRRLDLVIRERDDCCRARRETRSGGRRCSAPRELPEPVECGVREVELSEAASDQA
jgi:hypothetical protein